MPYVWSGNKDLGKDHSSDFSPKDGLHILAMAKKYQISRDRTEILNVWPIIRIGLAHQGHPRHNLQKLIHALETGVSVGWDEFNMDFDPGHAVVEISFLDQQACCEAKPLLRILYDFRQAVS